MTDTLRRIFLNNESWLIGAYLIIIRRAKLIQARDKGLKKHAFSYIYTIIYAIHYSNVPPKRNRFQIDRQIHN